LQRPALQAIWSPHRTSSDWEAADATFIRSSSGGGRWQYGHSLPDSFVLPVGSIKLKIKLTDFGHLGFFPEQQENWLWIAGQIRDAGRPINVLNLFAYTGGSTLAAAGAGAAVCHLDSAKGVVAWARENAALSGLAGRPVRWIVEDVLKFVRRERRRKRRYDAIILDPPSFGRGSKGEVWKIERDLPVLLHDCRSLLSDRPLFVLLTGHSPGLTPLVLHNLLADMLAGHPGHIAMGEMTLTESGSGRRFPNGSYARWEEKSSP